MDPKEGAHTIIVPQSLQRQQFLAVREGLSGGIGIGGVGLL